MKAAAPKPELASRRLSEAAVGPTGLPLLSFRARPSTITLLVAADVLVLEFSLFLGFMARQVVGRWFPIGADPSIYAGIAAGVLILPAAFHLLGLYPGYGMSDVERIRRQFIATGIVFSSLIIWNDFSQDGMWSRGILLGAWGFAALLVPPGFALARKLLMARGRWGAPTLVIGNGEGAAGAVELLNRDRKMGLVPVGVLNTDDRVERASAAGAPVLGTVRDAGRFAEQVGIALVAVPEMTGDALVDLSARLPFPRVVLLPGLGGLQTTWVSALDLDGVLGLEIKKNLLLPHNRRLKRILDCAICAPLFVLTLPLMALAAAAIAVVSPGRPLYAQEREGQHGRRVRVYKLRTMHADAHARLERHLATDPDARIEWSKHFKLREDPRILPYIGRMMRRASIDELPQLWNVLKGDMSLVGPRIFPEYHVENLSRDFRDLRRTVPPGLTGLWQVEVRADGDKEALERLDTYYIRNWSLWLDLYIMFRTVAVVLGGRGAR